MSARTSSATPRRRQRRALQRDNSFFGRIKTYVSSSLGWENEIQDDDLNDFDDDRDYNGKRRRFPQERVLVERENRQPKRARLGSPDLPMQSAQTPNYHDPPASAFTPSPMKPSLSSGITLGALSITNHRTPTPVALPVPRDSQPPKPYRLRMSITPQPPVHPVSAREVASSEPPSVGALISNPVFVRNASHGPDSSHSSSRSVTETTLGMLAESTRRTRSPTRSHSIMMADASPEPVARMLTPAERALQALDSYKTPILATQGQSADKSEHGPSKVYDMFSRRTRKLELLKGERDKRRLENIGKPVVEKSSPKPQESPRNDTKPYAGSGGMRKLLTRRKEEVGGSNKEAPLSGASPAPAVPSNADWSSGTSGVPSSLRVGRTKTSRVHLSRPARPANKFSATYDEGEGEGEEERRRKEEQELEDCAKNVPVFNMPAGFTFSKNTESLQPGPLDTKESSVPSLPFSLELKPASVSSASNMDGTNGTATPDNPLLPAFDFTSEKRNELEPELPPKEHARSVDNSKTSGEEAPTLPTPLSVPLKPLVLESLAAPTIRPVETPKPQSTTPTATPQPTRTSGPVVDVNSPFWIPEKVDTNKDKETAATPNLFSGFVPTDSSAPLVGSPQKIDLSNPLAKSSALLFGGSSDAVVETQPVDSVKSAESSSTATPSASVFAFSKPDTSASTTPIFFGKEPAVQPTSSTPLSFAQSSSPVARATPLTSPSKPDVSAASTPIFSFGAPSTTPADTPKSDTPKLVFGSTPINGPKLPFNNNGDIGSKTPSGTFSFGPTDKDQIEPIKTNSPFTFGASPATPSPGPESKPAFSFAPQADSTTPTAPVPASFSFGSSTVPVPASFSYSTAPSITTSDTKPFGFGQTPTRPITPPKDAGRDEMMEDSPNGQPQSRPGPIAPSFSFNSASSTSFDQSQSQPSPSGQGNSFAFGSGGGTSSSLNNPFSQPKRDSSPFVGQQPPQTSSGAPSTFSFGSQPDTKETQRPTTTGSFSFSSSTSTGSNSGASPFSFSTSQQGGASNPFGQTTSNPSSPSSFHANTTSGFPFGSSQASSAATTNSFQFAAAPPPPVAANSGSTTSFAFGGGQQQPTGAGGAAFTVGAASAPNPAAGGTRPRKGLPRRGKR